MEFQTQGAVSPLLMQTLNNSKLNKNAKITAPVKPPVLQKQLPVQQNGLSEDKVELNVPKKKNKVKLFLFAACAAAAAAGIIHSVKKNKTPEVEDVIITNAKLFWKKDMKEIQDAGLKLKGELCDLTKMVNKDVNEAFYLFKKGDEIKDGVTLRKITNDVMEEFDIEGNLIRRVTGLDSDRRIWTGTLEHYYGDGLLDITHVQKGKAVQHIENFQVLSESKSRCSRLLNLFHSEKPVATLNKEVQFSIDTPVDNIGKYLKERKTFLSTMDDKLKFYFDDYDPNLCKYRIDADFDIEAEEIGHLIRIKDDGEKELAINLQIPFYIERNADGTSSGCIYKEYKWLKNNP